MPKDEKILEKVAAGAAENLLGEVAIAGGTCSLKLVNGKLVGECDTKDARDGLGALLEQEVIVRVKPKVVDVK